MQFLYANLSNVLFVLLLISRLGDVGTTYLATPKLSLEANPIARKLGWKFSVLALIVCVVPYWSPQIAVSLLMASLLVSASNATKVWAARTLGERAYKSLMLDLARKSRLSSALTGIAAAAFFLILAGSVILFFYPSPGDDWGYWIGLGVALYGGVVGMWGTVSAVQLFRKAAVPSAN